MKNKPLELLILGAGNRGMYTYGELCKREDINARVVGVAEPIAERRKKMMTEHGVPKERCYKTAEDALKEKKFCDVVINSTPDQVHHEVSVMALEKGYHLLLEKPMSNHPKNCIDIIEAQEKSGKVISVAHVLRYAPFFQEIKNLIHSKELGNINDFHLLEEVGYWHFAHSYVRGNWRKESESGPVILTKSCHDLDIIRWLINGDIETIESRGSLKYFKEENSPKGSTDRCVESCKVKNKCPYNAEKFYLAVEDESMIDYPVNVISVDKSLKARKKALEKGPYGRCVYRCDNDVCDTQEVSIKFKNGIDANFKLTAFGSDPTRKLRVYLEKGEIHGDLSKGSIRVVRYSGKKGEDRLESKEVPQLGEHGGGDQFLLKNFIRSIKENNAEYNLTTAQNSLESHLMAFAAEESRLNQERNRGRVNFDDYKSTLSLKE